MDQLNTKRPDEIRLPSRFQIDDVVELCLLNSIRCQVHAVHFLPGKVKYDLDAVVGHDSHGKELRTRLYNVDSAFVSPYEKEDVSLLIKKLNDIAFSCLDPEECNQFELSTGWITKILSRVN